MKLEKRKKERSSNFFMGGFFYIGEMQMGRLWLSGTIQRERIKKEKDKKGDRKKDREKV